MACNGVRQRWQIWHRGQRRVYNLECMTYGAGGAVSSSSPIPIATSANYFPLSSIVTAWEVTGKTLRLSPKCHCGPVKQGENA